MKSYPSLENLDGKSVDELIALRQHLREVRDNQRVTIAEEITAKQNELRREGIYERRIFDIQLNELKRQLDEIGDKMGAPAIRVKAAEIREKISELKYRFNIKVAERDHRECTLANERVRRQSQSQLDYENAEIEICKAIRDKNGFSSLGFKQRNGNGEDLESTDNRGTAIIQGE